MPQQIALNFIAAFILEYPKLRKGFYSLGEYLQFQASSHCNDGARNGSIVCIVLQIPNE